MEAIEKVQVVDRAMMRKQKSHIHLKRRVQRTQRGAEKKKRTCMFVCLFALNGNSSTWVFYSTCNYKGNNTYPIHVLYEGLIQIHECRETYNIDMQKKGNTINQ